MGSARRTVRPLRPAQATHRLLLVFAVTILVPGLVLGFLGLRALLQERQLADQQVREQLAVIAESTGRQLELDLRDWQQAAEQLALVGPTDPARWPDRVRLALTEPGGAVLLAGHQARPDVLPAGQLLYAMSSVLRTSPAEPPSSLVITAETLELRDGQHDAAIALYREALRTAGPAERAGILHRLGRALKKADRTEDAARTFQLLEQEPSVWIGSLPSGLLALHALFSVAMEAEKPGYARRLYQGLVEGRWPLGKPSYAFYAEEVRAWVPHDEDGLRLRAQERRRLALSHATEQFLEDPRPLLIDGDVLSLAFWTEEPFVAILLGRPVVRSQLLPALDGAEFQASVVAPGGQMLVGDAPPAEQAVASYTLRSAELPLLLQVWPTDPAALQAEMNRQQNLYLGMLAVLVALLTFGGYFTVRTLRTQVRVAKMQSDFVSTVSHEFRSPLAGINQLGEMLRDGRVPDDRRREYYGMIVAETQRLRRQVENILSFSRIDDGRTPYRLEPLDPTGWLRDVSEEFQGQVADAGFTIEASIPDALPPIVADRDALTTAVHNLLDNAVKYSRESRTVQLEATANGDGLAIAVRDRGAGIRDADRPRIFEKFYRGGGELTERVKGVGLGLSLVQHIVTAHGGTVDVEGREGTGTTFTIRLKTGIQHA